MDLPLTHDSLNSTEDLFAS